MQREATSCTKRARTGRKGRARCLGVISTSRRMSKLQAAPRVFCRSVVIYRRAMAGGVDAYRGPGVLAGFPDDATDEPIIYDYSRIHPWSHSIVNLEDQWTECL